MATKPRRARDREQAAPDKVKDRWLRDAGTAMLGRRNFRLECRRGKTRGTLNFDRMVTNFSWSDTGPLLSGDVQLQLPRDEHVLDVQEGDLVICRVSYRPEGEEREKGWREVWRMRVSSIESQAAEGALTLGLTDELHRLMLSEDDFNFRKDKRHRNGWYCHQIAAEICDQYNVNVGLLMKGKHRIKRLTKQGTSPLEVIRMAYARERAVNGTRVVIRMRGGKLYVLPLRYSKFLYEFGKTLTGASIIGKPRKNFATVIEASGTTSTDRTDKRKIAVRVRSKKLLERFGLIVKQLKVGHVDSRADLRKEAKRHMLENVQPKRDLSISHPGIPSVARGDAVKVRLPKQGFRKEVLFVKEATHSVAPGSYEMELTLSYDDPIEDAKKDRECEQKCKKARENNRPLPKDCECPKVQDQKQPERNKNRQSSQADSGTTKRKGGTP